MNSIGSMQNQYCYTMPYAGGANNGPLFGAGTAKMMRKQARSKWQERMAGTSTDGDVCEIRERLRNGKDKKENQTAMEAILSNMQGYGQSVRTNRQQSQETSLTKKKLHYHFKSVSAKIISCKTSQTARQAVSQVQREILKLKRDKASGKYDSEEVEAAIVHAESMERVAKKKVRHLEEEEMARAAGVSSLEDGIGESRESRESETERWFEYERVEEQTDTVTAYYEENVEAYSLRSTWSDEDDAGTDIAADMQGDRVVSDKFGNRNSMYPDMERAMNYTGAMTNMDEMLSGMEDLTSEIMDAFSEGMRDLMDEMGFGDLANSLLARGEEAEPEELKMAGIKHRVKEMKEIAEADCEYLKAVFEHLEAMKNEATPSIDVAL